MLDVIPVFISAVAGIAYATFAYYLFRRRVGERGGTFRKAKEMFFGELRKRISLCVIQDLDDITMVKSWAERQEESHRFEEVSLEELLEEFLAIVTEDGEDEERVKNEYMFVESLIDKKRAQEPFSILSSREQTMAQMLQQSIESGQTQDALGRLQEFANVLGGRLEELTRASTRNRNLAIAAAIASISAIPFAIAF